MEHLRICFETVRFLVELGVDLVNIQRVMPNVCQVIARVHRFRFWEISYKRQQHYWFTLPITHFGKILANVNNKFILPILGKFLQMPTRNISSFQDRFISDHWKGKAKKKVDVCCPSFLLKWRREQFPSMRRWHLFPYRNPEIEGWHTKQRPMCFHKFSHNSLELFFQDTFYYIF